MYCVWQWPKTDTGNGHDGTVMGAKLTTDRKGSANSAYAFSGSDYIIIADAPQLRGGTTSVSVSLWFNISAYNALW